MRVLPTGAAMLAACALLAACGGGGSSPAPPGPTPTPIPTSTPTLPPVPPGLCIGIVPTGSATPTPGPTPVPDTRPSPTPAALSFVSVPSGIAVAVNNAAIGVTPTATTPPFGGSTNPFPNSQTLTTVSFANGGTGGAYNLCVQSNANPVTIFYNQRADTSGSIGSIVQSNARANAQSTPVRRELSQATPVAPDTTLLEVRYDPAAIAAGRVAPFALAARSGALFAATITPSDAPVRSDVVRVPAGSATLVAARLRAAPGVLSVQPVQYRYPLNTALPQLNDTLFDPLDQWDMYQIGMLHAWNYPAVNFGLSSVRIAVLDTGIDTGAPPNITSPTPSPNPWVQQDLISHVGIAESDITPVNGTGTVTTPCVTPLSANPCSAVQDIEGHGTNVAGIAAAMDNNGLGFAGVAGGVTLDIYKIISGQGATANASTSDEATAIYHAVANNDRVINLSLGAPPNYGPDFTEQDAVEYALSKGVLVVAAAGNERAQGVQGLDYPAAYPGVMAVGATALNDNDACAAPSSLACIAAQPTASSPAPGEYVAPYSNSGPGLGVVAPGGTGSSSGDPDALHWITNLYSTTGLPPCTNAAQCDVQIAGTSMATPHVTGAAALLLSANPSLSSAQLLALIDSTADNINDPNQGHGRLDVYRAMAQLEGDTTIAPYTPSNAQFVAFAYSNSGATNAVPAIIDTNFTAGVPVAPSGAFRVADIPQNAPSYRIAVWYDANGDGKVDAGDYFAASGICTASAPCASANSLNPTLIPAGAFTLP